MDSFFFLCESEAPSVTSTWKCASCWSSSMISCRLLFTLLCNDYHPPSGRLECSKAASKAYRLCNNITRPQIITTKKTMILVSKTSTKTPQYSSTTSKRNKMGTWVAMRSQSKKNIARVTLFSVMYMIGSTLERRAFLEHDAIHTGRWRYIPRFSFVLPFGTKSGSATDQRQRTDRIYPPRRLP